MGKRLAIDANRYADYCRDVPDARRVIADADEVVIPLIVLGELRAGFRGGSRAIANERTLTRFLSSNHVTVIAPDEVTTHLYGEIHADLRRAGTPIPTNDVWIAALCLQHDLVLFTRDAHFQRIARLATL